MKLSSRTTWPLFVIEDTIDSPTATRFACAAPTATPTSPIFCATPRISDAVVAARDGTVASVAYLLAETGIPLLPPTGTAICSP